MLALFLKINDYVKADTETGFAAKMKILMENTLLIPKKAAG